MTRVVTRSAGPTFREDPDACEVDLAHDPKAYPAEQVTRDGPVEGKRRGWRLACRLALSSCERTPVCYIIFFFVEVHASTRPLCMMLLLYFALYHTMFLKCG